MRLLDQLQCVLLLDAEVATRDQTFEVILAALADRGAFSRGLVHDLLAAMIRRDELGPTGIGEGVAIPHAWHPGLDRMVAALAVSPRGVDYGSLDGEPVHIVLLILSEPTAAAEAAKQSMFDGWLRRLRDPAFRAGLRLSNTPDELRGVVRREDQASFQSRDAQATQSPEEQGA